MHPRLHLKLAISFVDLLGKIICNDVTFSNSASESFMIILRRYHDHETMQLYMSSFTKVAMKFIVNFEKQKKDLAKTHRLEGDNFKTGKGNSIRQISNPEDQKMKWIQKTLFITLLKNVIEKIGSIHLNGMLKPEIVRTYLLIQRKHKIKHKGLLVLIQLFGNSDELIAEYKEANKNRSLEREDDVDLVSIRSHQVQNNLKKYGGAGHDSTADLDHNLVNLSVQHYSSKMSPLKLKSMGNVKRMRDDQSELDFSVMSDVPHRLHENHEKLMFQPDSISLGKYRMKNKLSKNDEKALKEIEKIKMRRQRRLEDQLFEEERKEMQQEKLRNQIQKELARRNIEHGVIPKSQKAFKKNHLIRDTSTEREDTLRKKPKIELYNFSLEEEKDKNDIHNFLLKYKKLLNHLFKTYSSTGFTHKNVNSFDAMHERLASMSLSECTIMLKKNSVIPELLHKEEAATILRMVNAHLVTDKRDNKTLSGKHFPHYFLQIAMFIFGRAPINLAQKHPIESVKALLKLFEKSTLLRGESIKLYENPDHTILADSDMIKELNKILKKNPDHPMPDGFKKVKIKEYKSIYKIPDYMPIAEPQKIAMEILDELLSKKFGFHIFEPLNKPHYVYQAKPILSQLIKHPVGKKDVPYIYEKARLPPKGRRRVLDPIPTRSYKGDRSVDRSVDRRNVNNKLHSNARGNKVNRSLPATDSVSDYTEVTGQVKRKRVYNDVTPDLSLSVKLEVVKYPMHVRDHVQEVAETLEEILEAASKGLTKLPPRKKHGFQKHMNKGQIMKKQKEEEEKKKTDKRLQDFENHIVELHGKLDKMKDDKSKQLKDNEQLEKEMRSKKKDKQKKKQEDLKTERNKRMQLLADKKKKEEQEKKNKEELKAKIQQELDNRKKGNRKDFLSKRKSQMRKEFKSLAKQRQGIMTEQDKLNLDKEMRKEKEKKLKQFFSKQRDLKAQNQVAKKDFLQFYDSPDVQKVLNDNFDTVSESYLKFSKQVKIAKKAQPSDFQMNFNRFKKFGHDMKIYPNIISFDDLSHIFKTLSKEKTDKRKGTVKANYEESKDSEKDDLHLTFNEFKDALTRISCLAKYKLGGLQGVSEEDAKNKDTELKGYLRNRLNKGGSKKTDPKSIAPSKKSKPGQLPAKSGSLTNQGSKSNLRNQQSNSYLYDKPKKLTKEEKDKKEHDLTMNAAKSFSMKKSKNTSLAQRSSSVQPSIIYEDTELLFPEIDSEYMTHNTVESLVKYLKQVIEVEKSGGNVNQVTIEKAANGPAGATTN